MVILAVDDDPLTLLNLEKMLTSPERKIVTAENGEKALKMVLEECPDILITDWRMPNLNGLELCKRMRQIRLAEHTYVIMLTGVESDDELVEAFDAGVDDYVVKPFTPKVLEARIRSGERIIEYQRTITDDRKTIEQYASKLSAANLKLQNMAMTDALTDLPNRRSAMARLKDIVAESTRFNEKLSCILIDIDHFKKINDTCGHDNGDRVLVEIAATFARQARSYDMISRIGGEEFLVISTRSNRSDALHLAERLRSAVENLEIALNNDTRLKVTISLGVAIWENQFADGNELVRAADRALYAAKENGRNRVEAFWDLN